MLMTPYTVGGAWLSRTFRTITIVVSPVSALSSTVQSVVGSKAGQFIASISQSTIKFVDYLFPILYATIRTNFFYSENHIFAEIPPLLHITIDAPAFACHGRPDGPPTNNAESILIARSRHYYLFFMTAGEREREREREREGR
jgi:hypothetical protein